jgi:CheY-like chemotaxis protein
MEAVGLQVFSAQSGEQGVQLAGQVSPDLIVVDLVMPGMSGFEVVSRLRADARMASIPILVLTAHSMTGEQRAELRGKVMEVIEKSEFRVAELIAEIRRAVRLI